MWVLNWSIKYSSYNCLQCPPMTIINVCNLFAPIKGPLTGIINILILIYDYYLLTLPLRSRFEFSIELDVIKCQYVRIWEFRVGQYFWYVRCKWCLYSKNNKKELNFHLNFTYVLLLLSRINKTGSVFYKYRLDRIFRFWLLNYYGKTKLKVENFPHVQNLNL